MAILTIMEQKQYTMEDIDAWRREIATNMEEMKGFEHRDDVENILRKLSAWSARSAEWHQITVRSSHKQVMDFRTKEVDYFHDEVDRQYKMWSRIHSVVSAEWENTR